MTDPVEGGEEVDGVGARVRVTSHVIAQRIAKRDRMLVEDGAVDHAQQTAALSGRK